MLYRNTSQNPSTATRNIEFVSSDGSADGNSAFSSVSVSRSNDAPTDISLDTNNVDENESANTVVGNLSTTDVDSSDTHTYSLVDTVPCPGPDNDSFNINGSQLRTSAEFDYETKNTYNICVRTNDGEDTYDKQFVIDVNDVNEAPYAPTFPQCEGETNPTDVTDLTPEFSWTFSDPDSGDTQSAYQIIVGRSEGASDMWDSSKVTSSSSSGVSYNGSALASSTTYHWKVKTWDNHDAAGSYCSDQTFTTSSTEPTVTTQAVTGITTTTATGNGNITDLGAPDPTAHGVCWNTTGTPTTNDNKTDEGEASSTGAFTSSITGLSPNTTYYVRAYATNTAGTSYGDEVSFTTSKQEPTVTTQAVTGITTTTATGNGNITDLGAPDPTAHGVCWNTEGTPTTDGNKTDEGEASSTGAFTSSITGLSPNTSYYVRAYATNSAGTSYGDEVSFTTSPQEPTVTTQAVTDITTTTATGNGNITDLGAPDPTAHGVCWNTTGTPTTGDKKTDEGEASSTGAFTSSITGLSPNTSYYVRAYATNSAGTSYGDEVTFTSLDNPKISGRITNEQTGISNVTLTFSNDGGTDTTDSSGNYSHEVPYNWSGTVIPEKEGYIFEPENRSYNNVTEDQAGCDFTGYPPPSVSITSPVYGVALLGTVTIKADVLSDTRISRVEFYINSANKGEDTVSPYEYIWDTASEQDGQHEIMTIAHNEKGQTGMDLAIVEVCNEKKNNLVISGNVIDSENNGIPEVVVTFSDSGSTSTDENGYFTREVPYRWSGTLTLSKSAFKFEPASRSYDNVTTDQPGQDFYGESLPKEEVSGEINKDTTWTSDNYYVVTGNITVSEGATLTIEAGTVVVFEEETAMTVQGGINACGTGSEPIVLISEDENHEGINLYGLFINLSYCVILNVGDTITIGERSSSVSDVESRDAQLFQSINVDHCTFSNNLNGILITGSNNIKFVNNIVKDAKFGLDINLSDSNLAAESVIIKNNIFTRIEDVALKIDEVPGNYEISGNSFFNNEIYNVYLSNSVGQNLNMRHNYWGTLNTEEISEKIYDNEDDPSKGAVEFEPYLTEPCPDAPAQAASVDISPPAPLNLGIAEFRIRFNCRMDMLEEPWVSFGLAEPYEDYTVKGSWEDNWIWSGIFYVKGTTKTGLHTIKVSRAKGKDRMMVTNEYRHKFEIAKSVVLALEALRAEERALIVTKEYGDIRFYVETKGNTSVSRYIIYRKILDGGYKLLKDINGSEIKNGYYSYYDKYLMKEIRYTYKVVAVDANGVILASSNEKTI